MSDKENEERLAAAKARLAAAEKKREERDEAEATVRELERLEREARDTEALTDLEAVHGRLGSGLAMLQTELGAVIVKRAPGPLFKRFAEIDEKIKVADCEKLVRPCVVYPVGEKLDAIFDRYHAAPIQLAGLIRELHVGKVKEAEGK